MAPEIILATPKGNVITLSSLKGKVVLIDFWASWCSPCRAENPTVVAVYNKYHTSHFKNGKGFEVLSISLDQNEMAWEKAIEKDKLVWPYHVSDLRGWDNAAAQRYGINSIPTNVLVDGSGIIIAKNLRGELLEKTMELQLK
jgi:thiol-disulfide isomerase/thioredoxin